MVSAVMRADPGFADAHNNLGDALYYFRGETAEALAEWREVLRIRPDDVAVLNHAARVLAASRNDAVRNGREAVTLAERAAQLSNGRKPEILDTLAAAYAETGQFARAASTERQAKALFGSRGDSRLASELDARAALYESGRPLREARP
jgi:predicted O-linked N-acetylglucosamine transferase (SPINDLY family)